MKKLQSGRSMIEMLGVLAIIGVLSIGGLAAYSTAMTRVDANEILNFASVCAVMAETEKVTDCTDIAGLDKPDTITAATASVDTSTGAITIKVTPDTDGVNAVDAALSKAKGNDAYTLAKETSTPAGEDGE